MKKRESVIYLKCCTDPGDGSAQIENGELKVILSTRLFSGSKILQFYNSNIVIL